MKKIFFWTSIGSIIIFLIVWGIIGLKLLNGNYEITIEAYISFVLFIIFFISLIGYKLSSSRCPYCGKIRLTDGDYCSYCGKKISD